MIKHLKFSKVFINFSQTTVYKNLEGYNTAKTRKILIVFDDMIDNIKSNKKLSPKITAFFIRRRKLNISLVFIPLSHIKTPKGVRQNVTHCF